MEKILKKLKKLLRLIFGRTTLGTLFLLIQILVLFAGFDWFREYLIYMYGGSAMLSALVLIYIISDEGNSTIKLSWVVPILIFPVFGTLFYLFLTLQPGTRRINRRIEEVGTKLRPYFGGFNSVTKTDGGNLIMLTISIVVVYFVVVGGIEGSGFLTNAEVFSRNAAGSGTDSFGNLMKDYSLTMYLTMFFGWGMGLAANPQYLIRIVAAKSRETARKVLICSLVFLTFFYFCLTQIGLGLRILFPYLSYYFGSDDIFVYAINYLLRSRFSGFFLISVIGACMSTANSQLLLIGSMMSYDVAAQYGKWKKTEDRILGLTQLFIFLGGTLALLLSLNPPSNSLFFGADIWGLFSAILTPLLYGTLYYKRATRTGAWAAFVTGVTGTVLLQPRELPVYWGFPVTLCSTLVFVLAPVLESIWKKRAC